MIRQGGEEKGMDAIRGITRRAGPGQWRSLDDPHSPAAEREFPWRDSDDVEGMDRREFSRVMAAALAMAGLSGCTRQPPEKILPYVNQPEGIVQGKPLFFATAMPHPGYALGLLVKSHMGHPIKIEGNPRHPASLGGTDPFAQASLLTLYDPARSPTVTYRGQISTWTSFIGALMRILEEQRAKQGAGLRILTETVISPALGWQIQQVLSRYPAAKWLQYEPVNRDNARAGALMAFGRDAHPIYDLAKADVILSLGSDFLSCGAGSARYARDFASRRGLRAGAGRMSRLYVVESAPSNTGASADHRLPLREHEIDVFTRALAQAVGVPGVQAPSSPHRRWVSAIARDLRSHRGACAVIVGAEQPPVVHALAHAINAALGNAGNTVRYTSPVEINPVDQMQSLRELAGELNAGKVEALVILGGNPVYTAPADLDFARALSNAKFMVHLSLYDDETSALSTWHVPQRHFLEEWSDALAFDGTAAIIQPLITPLFEGRSVHELLNVMLGNPDRPPDEVVREYWRSRSGTANFEDFWRASLYQGVVEGTALPAQTVAVRANFAAQLPPLRRPGGGLEVVFRPDPTIWDGRFANNGYLQELPKPVTKLTWDNAALVSPATAARLGVYSYGVVELEYRGRRVRAPLWVTPGHADDCVTLHLGYGRTRAGPAGNGAGFNAYLLRTSDAPWSGTGLQVRPTGASAKLACTQTHGSITQRYPVRVGTLETFRRDPHFARKAPFEHEPPPGLTLYPEWRYGGYKWGMSIDLNACVGCNACVVACQTENNIAIVGKEEVFKGREMHWLRVDRYFEGDRANPKIHFQPMLCVHCENAPCEPVCPVEATVHSSEGLNQMIYNRCVGTRYCSNNCPYKVRRFNFLLYSDWYTETLKLMRNPDVTVRSRGVMEKCTFCVQRIEQAKIQAKLEDRRVRDGEVVTACQQACPTEAIIFGDLNDPGSKVSRLKRQPIDYGLLAELNTRPRLTYLARILNPNPELETA